MDSDVVRVLIVEDDPAWTDLYVLYLHGDENLRYEATVVDGEPASLLKLLCVAGIVGCVAGLKLAG